MKVARFDPSGKIIVAGTTSGNLLVFNARTKIVCPYFQFIEPDEYLLLIPILDGCPP